MIRVLFCGLKYDYGQPAAGLSFEYQNFYEVLHRMVGVEASGFFFDELGLKLGRAAVDPLLIKTVEEQKPDLLFCLLFTDELKKETIEHITRKTGTKTFNWFTDDHWRLSVYSRYWAPLFTLAATTDSRAPAKYRALGIKNVIKTQWAANAAMYKPQEQSRNPGNLDITFVGKNYGNRGRYLAALQQAGLPAAGYGGGWPAGRLDQQKMLEVFSYSKINLNFTETPYMTVTGRLKTLAKLFVKKEHGKYTPDISHFWPNIQSARGTQRRQIKGRNFEVPACGGFLMTGDADNLRDYYADGREIVIFSDQADLLDKCRYYLAHEAERKAIARAGYERTIAEHTYEKRFQEIFKAMELN